MSVTAPAGFVASAVAAGIKPGDQLDMALVAAIDGPVPAAAVFTRNRAAAASVHVSRQHLTASAGRAAGVVLTSGNANAATGRQGRADAEELCALVAAGLGVATEHVLVCQTGLIGIPMPMPAARRGIGPLVAGVAPTEHAGTEAARAIMTTDTVVKQAVASGAGFRVGAMAKGAAMLAPDMATMLAVLTTDARAEPGVLAEALRRAVAGTFNRLSVDGCTSTNDTVVVLASGRAETAATVEVLTGPFTEVCRSLADAMAADAEGATKVLVVRVCGAADDDQAHRAARRVAESQLVQCSLNGADPYWGRVVSELGSAQVDFDIDRVEVAYGGVVVCRGGVAADHDVAAVHRHMAGARVLLDCDLGLGSGSAAVVTTDLSHAYIDENRRTS